MTTELWLLFASLPLYGLYLGAQSLIFRWRFGVWYAASARDEDKPEMLPMAKRLHEMGFSLAATDGTGALLRQHGIESRRVMKIEEGHPNAIDLIEEHAVAWIVNTPSGGASPRLDEVRMRAHAVIRGIPITTTIDGFRAAVNGLAALRKKPRLAVRSLQEYHADVSLQTAAR